MKEQKKIGTNTLEILPFYRSENTRPLDETIKMAPTKGELEHQQAASMPSWYPRPLPHSVSVFIGWGLLKVI
jgi:hypothetical protein